ncbi:hypothetical protein [Salinimicrobium flavum]|uniref:Cthe-2314-like HEPN domain-containing protein n=1 Tax=Salinimicrobium flavum TaxID=1737065 RepID=A0ABW5IXB7_9FLAO
MKDFSENYLFELSTNLDKFKRYNSMMEGFLRNEFSRQKEELEIDKFYKKTEKDFTELINITMVVNDHLMFYPQNFRTSLLVQIFSLLEHKLGEICLYHHLSKSTDFSIKDLKGNSDIDKAKLYLKKACKIDFKHLDPEWNFLEKLRKIRNLIVHNKGEISGMHRNWNSIFSFISNNKDILSFSQNIEYMSKEEFQAFHDKELVYNIEIEPYDCIERFLETIKLFFEKLFEKLNSI